MKQAFTLLELIFVLIVIGILSSMLIPRTQSNTLHEAATQLVSHIRYTQHLAIVDDKFNSFTPKKDINGNIDYWFNERWSIRFNKDAHSNREWAYTIFADTIGAGTGNADIAEIAIDPQNIDKVLSGGITGNTRLNVIKEKFVGNKKMNLGLSYGVISVKLDEGCREQSIAFDYLGRPINSRLSGYSDAYEVNDLITRRCEIILESNDGNITIAIEAETGYAYILE